MTRNAWSRPRLSRRALLQRLAVGGVGALSAALVGCGAEDAPRSAAPPPESQPEPQPQAQAPPQTQPQAQPAAAPQTDAQSTAQPTAPPQPEPAVQPTQQSAQPAQSAASAPATARRLLVPELTPAEYDLQDSAFAPLDGARVDFGVIDGAGYRIELPEQWNGELVLWAHGFRGLNDDGTGYDTRLTFDELPARELIVGQGFGWATSTYRVNGYVPGVGVDDLLQVKDRAAAIARPPSRTYIAGGSMGGATAQLMAQEFPDEIDAALAFCPALGNIWVVDYLAAWHALAHYLIGSPPTRLDAAGLVEWGAALGVSDADGLALTPAGEQFAALIHDFTGGSRWGFAEGLRQQWNNSFGLGAVLWPELVESGALTPGSRYQVSDAQPPADTSGHIYHAAPAAGLDLEQLNAEVIRVTANPERRRDPGIGLPTGDLKVPLLTMTTTGDLYTPIHLARDYQRLVNESGDGAQFIAQPVRRAGHCAFSEPETLGAFTSIVAWLGFGIAPSGEDLQGDLNAVGTRFTNPFDADDPLRPAG